MTPLFLQSNKMSKMVLISKTFNLYVKEKVILLGFKHPVISHLKKIYCKNNQLNLYHVGQISWKMPPQ